ncbi:MAG: deoxyribodipyrimidine photo-lyase [Candidatus Zambryskibacteria bacterium]|nr:deoxyribodipyrimidine photo-lyase [Candidatus Zambryskibacteria bacterium]
MSVDQRRIRSLNNGEYKEGLVLYWMNRDMRIVDNWAFIRAEELAEMHGAPLHVVYNLVPNFLGGGSRQLDFKIQALKELMLLAKEKNISFTVTTDPIDVYVERVVKSEGVGFLVTDFSPLKISREWLDALNKKIHIPFEEVDAHNIVPCFFVSQKQEFAAYTLRPKIEKVLSEFLIEFPKKQYVYPRQDASVKDIDYELLLKNISVTQNSQSPLEIKGGASVAKKVLHTFIKEKLEEYDTGRNDPTQDFQSGLSPYLHYGNISAQRVALEVEKSDAPRVAKDAFLEELIVRKELSDNFCLYNTEYDSVRGFPNWSKLSLDSTRNDLRDYVYTQEEFELGATHDPLWNAAQTQMVREGKMHGYMRMYWAKKILEWTESPEDAMRIAIYLNDTYELDGRDPNGYAGIAWSIGGVHDRAWFKRPVYGQVRYMNANGAAKKFDVDAYIKKYS